MYYRLLLIALIYALGYYSHPAMGQTWQELFHQSDSLHRAANNDSAIIIGHLALRKIEEECGTIDTAYARMCNRLSSYYYVRADYPEALRLRNLSLDVAGKTWGETSRQWSTFLHGLGDIYQAQARYAEAERVYLKTIAGYEQILGPVHVHTGEGLNSLAQLYRRLGRLAEAEQLLKRAISIWDQIPDAHFFRVSRSYHQLALVCHRQGKISEAILLGEKALEIREKGFGPDHYEVASCLNNLSNFYADLGQFSQAESLQFRSLATMEEILGPNHPWVAFGLSDLAAIQVHQNKFAEAEKQSLRALMIIEKALGPDHPDIALIQNQLGNICGEQERYEDAGHYFDLALQVRENALGQNHYYLAETLEDYSKVLRARGDYSDAMHLAARACEIRRINFVDNAIVLPETDALTYSRFLRRSVDNILSCCHVLGMLDTATAGTIADIVLSSKGQVSDGIFERQKALVRDTDSVSVDLMDGLKMAKLQISQLYVRGSGKDFENYRTTFDSLENKVHQLEASLSLRSASFKKHRESGRMDMARVASLLPANSILVEFLKYNLHQSNPNRENAHYLVVVLDDDGNVELFQLGRADEIDDLIDRYRQHMVRISKLAGLPSDDDLSEYSYVAKALYSRIWKPIESFTIDKELVLLAPDAGLALISFATLINSEGEYLIEMVPIHYLSAGRDLARLHDKARQGIGMFAIGAPDYNASLEKRLTFSDIAGAGVSDSSVPHHLRNIVPECDQLTIAEATALPLTRFELQEIVKAWKRASNEPVVFYSDAAATEDKFKAEAPGHRVIHLATHGYYISDACQNRSAAAINGQYRGDNPLLLSGLFLAGANLRGEGSDSASIDDGILTAYEISAMDFHGTDMVVLSACETGLGSVREGEGVYGLRRAFQMAGARSVISSLWAVSDRHTAKFMSKLYIHGSEIMPIKMRKLQIAEIQELRSKGFPDHPVNWGAFIVSGDWQ
jgi:CHAT domain-containing protein